MAKKKISKKQEALSEKLSQINLDTCDNIFRERPLEYLTDENKIGEAILYCLKNNDPDGVMEIFSIYLNALNKAKLVEKGHIPKSTLYNAIRNKNPTIKTLAKMVYSYSH